VQCYERMGLPSRQMDERWTLEVSFFREHPSQSADIVSARFRDYSMLAR